MSRSRISQEIARAVTLVAYGIGLFALLVVFMVLPGSEAVFHLLVRLVGGFYFFLSKNLPSMSVNADVLVPGVIAFCMVVGMVHWIGSSWSAKRGRRWSLISSIAASSCLPLMFSISFLVPGILLQVRGLVEGGPVLTRGGGVSERAHMMMHARSHAQFLCGHMLAENPDRYPNTILTDELPRGGHDLIYPAAGLRVGLDPSFPVIITPPYRDRDGVMKRWVFRADEEFIEIPADDVDEWLDRALEMRIGN